MRPRPARARQPQERIGRLQVEHLAATGCRHPGLLRPPAGPARLSGLASDRLDGVRQACADLDEPVVTRVVLDSAAAADVVADLHAHTPTVSGICASRWLDTNSPSALGFGAFNDYTALALVAGMHDLGLTHPRISP